jgi:shikimate kinase
VRLILIGLPGSGKSTVGRQLARRLRLAFSDSDHVIEQRIGGSITSFFEREGEQAFRDVEEQVIEELCGRDAVVIATGGGAVLRQANRERLHAAGPVFYLHSTPEDVFRRVKHDKGRPLLQVADPLGRVRELFAQRDPLYRETAHFIVETGRPSVPALVSKIVTQLELSGLLPPHP